MANIQAIDIYRFALDVPMELAGKIRTWLKGRECPARPLKGRNIRKPTRKMTASDMFVDHFSKEMADVRMDAESIKWVEEQLAKNQRKREYWQEKAKAKRKPRDQWEKCGPKPGKKYPKFLAAMKKLGEDRRANGWKKGSKKSGKTATGK